MMLSKTLLKTQHNSEDPTLFEKALTSAFKKLGFDATHIGGRDKPDILINVFNHTIVVDAKTTKQTSISETYVNFDALERYKEHYEADRVGVVAVGFSRGAVRETAEKRKVTLVETDAICKALQNHSIYPYDLKHIYTVLFESGKNLITPKNVEPSTKKVGRKIEVLKQILSDLKRSKKSSFTQKFLHDHYLTLGFDYSESEIEDALKFLSNPPFIIFEKEDDRYSMTLETDEIFKRLGMFFEALKPPPKETVEGKVTARMFKHIGKGIFVLEADERVRLDLNKPSREVEEELKKHGLGTQNIGGFYYNLRRKAGLLHKGTY